MSLLLVIAGCSWFEPDLLVTSIQPEELRVGSDVRVVGEGFSPEVAVALMAGETRVPLESVAVKDQGLIEARIPDIEPGPYELVVSRDGGRASASLQIGADHPDDGPCSRGYEANTHLSLPEGVAVIVRFHPDGKRERVETPITEIERLEYTVSELEDGTQCAAIVLRRSDGAAVLFEDDEGDLRERAETLAEFMDKDLTIVE